MQQQLWSGARALFKSHTQAALISGALAAAGSVWTVVRYVRSRRHAGASGPAMDAATKAQCALIARHAGDEARKVHLYTFPQTMLAPSFTPYGVRLETFLILANIPYEKHSTMSTAGSPNGCSPFAVYNGQCLADSYHIMDVLTSAFHVTMDESLTDKQLAIAKSIRATVDYSLFPAIMHSIYHDDPKRRALPFVAAGMGAPQFMKRAISALFRFMLRNKLRASGKSALSKEQYVHLMLNDIKMLESILGDQPFFFGNKPTTTDCIVYAILLQPYRLFFLTNTHPPRQTCAIREGDLRAANEHGKVRLADGEVFINEAMQYLVDSITLNNYVQRMTERVFPHLDATLAPSSPTKAQRDIKVLAAQAEHIKCRMEQTNNKHKSDTSSKIRRSERA